jgi:hypothetical protein
MEILKYENFKKEVKENYPIRKNVTLMGLNINFEDSESRNGSVSIDGVRLRLSSNAFKTLLKTLNITDTFMGKFTDIFGMNSRNQLIKIIKNKISSQKDMKVSIYISPSTMSVVAITDSSKPYVSPDFYFNMVENVINDHQLEIGNMSISSEGNVQVSTIKNNWGFDIPDLKDESFHTGVIVTAGPTEDISIDPYILRLICENGLVGPRRLEMGPRLLDNSVESINKFMNDIKSLSHTNQKFQGIFSEQVRKMSSIHASYNEVLKLRDLVLDKVTDKNDSRIESVVDRFFPVNEIQSHYKEKGYDLDKLTNRHWKNTKTNMTTWDLLNAITDIGSHDYGMGIGEYAKNDLRRKAGLFMFKKEFDCEFLMD